MKVKAYAKINLGLKVLGKREDGYHELEMIMVNIDLRDILSFRVSNEVNVIMDKAICKMEENIVYKTAVYMKNKYNVQQGIKIKIKKRIPDGGGMGGGSSNAASTIIALNKLWNLGLSIEEMMEIAANMGSDVPFFIVNRLSFVKGRGEKIEVINKKICDNVIIFLPDMKCSTKEIFNNYKCEEKGKQILDIYNNIENKYYKYLFNDLEELVCDMYPDYPLKTIKQDLEKVFDCKVMMSGSGSSFFVLGKGCDKEMYKYIKNKYKDIKVVKSKVISCCENNIKQ